MFASMIELDIDQFSEAEKAQRAYHKEFHYLEPDLVIGVLSRCLSMQCRSDKEQNIWREKFPQGLFWTRLSIH
jgi:hypothetical protein